jgi:protein O-mannosyl-transferase
MTIRPREAWPRWHAWMIVALALAAAAPSLGNRFAYDDDAIIAANPLVHTLTGVVRAFGSSYWPPALGGALYRPLPIALFALEWAVGHGAPIVFHLVNVSMYATICVLVLAMGRRLLPAPWALVAAALFAVHPVHVEVVANVVGQSELLVTGIALVAVTRYLDGSRNVLVMCGLYALGLLAKEHAAVIPLLLLAAELTVLDDGRPWQARAAAARPLGGALALTFLIYLGVRLVVLHGAIGESALIPLVRAPWATRWWTTMAMVPEWVRLLVWPDHLEAVYAPPEIAVRATADLQALLGLGTVIVAAVLCVVGRRRMPVPVFGTIWMACALLPVSNLLIPSGVLLAERSLFLPSVGVVLSVGLLASVRVSWPAVAVASALVMAGLVRSIRRAPVWRDDATLWAVTAAEAPRNYFAHYQYAGQLFQAGRADDGEREMRTAIALEPQDPRLYSSLGWRLTNANRCTPAIPLFRQAVALWPLSFEGRAGLVTCLMRTGSYAEARSLATAAVARGGHQAFFVQAMHAADSAQSIQHH